MNLKDIIQSAPLGRHFSYAVVTWKIRNISLALCSPANEIESPKIIIPGPVSTVWKLFFRILQEPAKRKVILYLRMQAPNIKNLFCGESEDSRIAIKWAAGYLDSNGECPLVSEREFLFAVGDRLEVESRDLDEFLEVLPQIGPDELNVKCSMLVDFGNHSCFLKNAPEGVVALSDALSRLLQKNEVLQEVVDDKGNTINVYSDLTINVGGKRFDLHREMLSRRGPGLAALMKLHHHPTPILDYDAECVESLLKYIYSGDLTHVLSFPRIAICESIERLGIDELKDAYPKTIIKVESGVEGKEHTFRWLINDFTNIVKPVESPVFPKEGSQPRWQLSLYSNRPSNGNEQQKKYVYLEACLIESEKTVDVCLECACIDPKNEIVIFRRGRQRMAAGDRKEFILFGRGSVQMERCLFNDELSLRFTTRIATGATAFLVSETVNPSPLNFNNRQCLLKFSDWMKLIYSNPKYTDLAIKDGMDELRVHKFLLAARSNGFNLLLRSLEDRKTLSLPFMRLPNFEKFMCYLYTGQLGNETLSAILDLYLLGKNWRVMPLVAECHVRAREWLTPENGIHLLIAADTRHLEELRDEAIQLIMCTGKSIFLHPQWFELMSSNPGLAQKIKDDLDKMKR